ncbi:autotransporter outer membrane beta-barrel domain-containing protein [Moraxella lacunata]|uniref:Autotransporter domain-containing protein n=1 Tax=Moraxella lacunata TaxID=477 RepID=A0A1B8PYL5_MORLA|nr:autotransporter outer membrane beta-barrel domain-containing protein [Moraxella lacunata]OBX61201.1 hypothetical protein A9309_08485 [Moraxella lacunata]
MGGAGTGKLVAKNNDSSIVADTLTIAAKTGSRGDVLIEDNAYLEVQDITVGEQGVGNLTFKQLWQIYPIQNITLGKSQTGVGTLHLDTETSTAINTITVGEQGQGVLKITGTDKQPAMLEVHQIQRSPDAQRSEIHLNGAGLVFTQDQNNLFAGFNQNNKIEIGKEGLWVQMGDLHRDDTPANVIINPEAVITGDVGQTVAVTIDEQNEFVSGGFIMNGSGMLTLSENSKKFTGDIGAIDGTLKIDGNLKMAGENLVIGISDYNEDSKIDKDDRYGKVIVTGTADIDNGNLKALTQDFIKDTNKSTVWHNVLTAGTLNGRFKNITDNSPLVDFEADYSDTNKVHLKLAQQGPTPTPNIVGTFENAVNSQNKNSLLNLAQVLDTHKDTNTNPLGLALTLGASGLDNAKLTQGASELAPLMHGSTAHVIANAQDYAFGAIHARHLDRSRSVWAKAIGTQGKLQENELLDYDTTDIGAIVGADTAVGRGNIGLALSYIHSDVDSRGNARHDATVKSTQVLGYGDYDINDRVSVHATVGVGRADIDGKRHISTLTAGNTATATADYTADTAQAGFEIRHRFGTDTRRITPFIGMKYTHVSSDGYTETGAGVYNLAVQKASFNEISQNFGIRLQQAISPRTTITGELSGSVYGGERTPITASFVNADDSAFTLNGQELGRTAGNVGLGMTYKPTTNTTLSLGYQGQWRKNYDNQGAALGFEMKF